MVLCGCGKDHSGSTASVVYKLKYDDEHDMIFTVKIYLFV